MAGRGLKLLSVLRDEDVIERARAAATQHLATDPELAASPALAEATRRLEDSEQAEYLEMTMRPPDHRRHRRRASAQDPDGRGHPAHVRPGARGALLGAGVAARLADRPPLPRPVRRVGGASGSRRCRAVRAWSPRSSPTGVRPGWSRTTPSTLGFRKVEVVALPVARVLGQHARAPYDVVFADPPYPLDNAELEQMLALLVAHGWVAAGIRARGRAFGA